MHILYSSLESGGLSFNDVFTVMIHFQTGLSRLNSILFGHFFSLGVGVWIKFLRPQQERGDENSSVSHQQTQFKNQLST